MQMAEQTAEPMAAIEDIFELIPPNTNSLYNTNNKNPNWDLQAVLQQVKSCRANLH